MADHNTIARPYAQAVFELAHESGDLEAWAGSLEIARALLEDGRVVGYLADPDFSDTQRAEFLTGLFADAGSDKLGGEDTKGNNFLKLLIENDRVAVLPQIAERFSDLKANVENLVDVVVTSACPLSDDQQQAIAAALRDRLGREVKLESEIDENLIGGAVIKAAATSSLMGLCGRGLKGWQTH